MDSGLEYGTVFFEDTSLPRIATTSRAGTPGNKRIPGIEDLSSDTVWLTNLDSNLMYERKLHKNARLRNRNYLRQDINQILDSIGMKDVDDGCRTKVAADIFERVIRISKKVMKLNYVPQRSLREGLRRNMGPPNKSLDPNLVKAFKDALKFYTNCQSSTTQENEAQIFNLNPIEHTEAILRAPVPHGDWVHTTHVPGKYDIAAWIVETGPVLARVTINRIDPSVSSLLNYGDDLSVSKMNRQWLTANELLYLVNIAADIQMHEAYIPDNCITHTTLCEKAFDLHGYDCNILSLSWGIFLDNLWTGASMAIFDRSKGTFGEVTNPIGPFIRAHDRTRCMEKAIELQQLGFDINGYGAGKINVNGVGFSDLDLFRAARTCGLLPPPGKVKFEDFGLNESAFDDPLTLRQSLYAQSDYVSICALDEQVVDEVICSEP